MAYFTDISEWLASKATGTKNDTTMKSRFDYLFRNGMPVGGTHEKYKNTLDKVTEVYGKREDGLIGKKVKTKSTPDVMRKSPSGKIFGTLQYPYGEYTSGHYIVFTVYDQTATMIQAAKSFASAGPVVSGGGNRGGKNYSLRAKTLSSTVPVGQIALYMPPSVQVSDNVKFADKEIGLAATGIRDAVSKYTQNTGFLNTLGSVASSIGTTAGAGIASLLLSVVDTVAGGAKSAIEIAAGSVVTPHMELMFEGVQRREFTYTFTFTPRNARESEEVRKIVKEFRRAMYPEYPIKGSQGGIQTRVMRFPSTFTIQYMYDGGAGATLDFDDIYEGGEFGVENRYISKTKAVNLTKADVTHGGGEGYTSVGSAGAPQKTTLALSFSEIEIITKDQVEDGF